MKRIFVIAGVMAGLGGGMLAAQTTDGSTGPGRPALVLASATASEGAEPQAAPLNKDDLFAGTERFEHGAKDVTEVNLDKKMLAMASNFAGGNVPEKQMDLARKMDFVYVRTYAYAKEGQYNLADIEPFRQRLQGANWSHVVKEHSEKENTDVWMQSNNDGQLTELVVIDAGPKELTFVHLKGHMSMEELSKAGGSFGVPQDDPKLKRRAK